MDCLLIQVARGSRPWSERCWSRRTILTSWTSKYFFLCILYLYFRNISDISILPVRTLGYRLISQYFFWLNIGRQYYKLEDANRDGFWYYWITRNHSDRSMTRDNNCYYFAVPVIHKMKESNPSFFDNLLPSFLLTYLPSCHCWITNNSCTLHFFDNFFYSTYLFSTPPKAPSGNETNMEVWKTHIQADR